MWDLIGIGIVAGIFTVTTVCALCRRKFTYRFGPTILRAERPVEYWVVTLLFLATTCLMWLIFVLIAIGHLKKWQG